MQAESAGLAVRCSRIGPAGATCRGDSRARDAYMSLLFMHLSLITLIAFADLSLRQGKSQVSDGRSPSLTHQPSSLRSAHRYPPGLQYFVRPPGLLVPPFAA